MKKRKKKSQAGVVFTAVVLLLLVALAAFKLKGGVSEETENPELQMQQSEQPETDVPEAEIPEAEELETEEQVPKSEEEERAAFLPDYASAPLLNTTAIKCLSMEIGETEHEVRFNWLSPSASKGMVNWKNAQTGEVQSFEAQCTASVTLPGYYVNKATVTGLQTGASYTYQVGNEEAWSPEYSY